VSGIILVLWRQLCHQPGYLFGGELGESSWANDGDQRQHRWSIAPSGASLEPIIAKVSQETLAEMIGTTRSRVSYFMNKFRKLGLIDYNGRIEIHSSLLNVVLHEEPHINS
jgi:CRP-like cAMP-binding protein